MFLRVKDQMQLAAAVSWIIISTVIFPKHPQHNMGIFERNFWLTYAATTERMKKDSVKRNLPEDCIIPKMLFQTTQYSKYPDLIGNYLGGFKRRVFNDQDAYDYVAQWHPGYLDAYNILKGAHKADLWRYLVLFDHGGVYLDIKTIVVSPLNATFSHKRNVYTVLGTVGGIFNPHIHNGILASCQANPLLLKLANHMRQTATSYGYSGLDYMKFVHHMYFTLSSEFRLRSGNSLLLPGVLQASNATLDLMVELCHETLCSLQGGVDRYGLCCGIFQNQKLRFIERDPTYPKFPRWQN